MNVMEAFEKIGKLDDKISALRVASLNLDKHEHGDEIGILKEIGDIFVKERNQLQDRLEKTQLANIR